MITDTNTSTGDVWTYAYNFCGQMTGAVEKTSGGTVLAQVSYTYDALGNRIGMDENGTQTWTRYDGTDPIMDFSSSGSLEMRYLNGPTGQLVDSVLARESSSGTVAWYLPDRLGTVRDLINNSGAIIDHIDFNAFGTVLDQSAPSEGDRMMGFAGMEQDSVTGMNLAVYRVQNPGTGRWTSQDPLGFGGGQTDLESYADNNSVDASDPSGLFSLPSWEDWENTLILGPRALLAYLYGDQEWVTGNAESAMRESLEYVSGVHFCNINDLGEAVKHAMFQALLTALYGEDQAARIGNNHEDSVLGSVLDSGRDQFNNSAGRNIGREIRNMPGYGNMTWEQVVQEARKRVYQAAKNGDLVMCLTTDDKRLVDAAEAEQRRKAELEERLRGNIEFMRQGTTG
jgi:RHS repeat-associated protein